MGRRLHQILRIGEARRIDRIFAGIIFRSSIILIAQHHHDIRILASIYFININSIIPTNRPICLSWRRFCAITSHKRAVVLIQFGLQTILHKFGNGFLEQVLDVVRAVDVRHLQQFTDLCSTGFFFRASILSGHIFFLHPDASILHLFGGLHNYWDGLGDTVWFRSLLTNEMIFSYYWL